MRKLNVAILCGGISSEHEISCLSAGGVLSGIDSEKFNPILIGITKAGKWVAPEQGAPKAGRKAQNMQ